MNDEIKALRKAQAREVMPIIGPLLDAWEGLPNDVSGMEELEELAGYMQALESAMDADPEDPDPKPAARRMIDEIRKRDAKFHNDTEPHPEGQHTMDCDCDYIEAASDRRTLLAERDSIRDALRIVQRASIAHAGEQNGVIAALREQVRGLLTQCNDVMATLHCRDLEVTRLQAALIKYAQHGDGCPAWDGEECTCGADAALASKGDG